MGRALLAALTDAARTDIPAEHIAIVVAHPDDETIGAGGQLPRLRGVTIIHVTDGAPADMVDARALGFATREAYAAARRQELEAAMAIAGIPASQLLSLGRIDQEAALDMAALARELAGLFSERGIAAVLTHPFEGGHPDHDATAFSVHAAAQLMARAGAEPPAIVEMASYHAGPEGRVTQRFLPTPAAAEVTVRLDEPAMALKQRMMAAHATQRRVLAAFDAPVERFRLAPAYEFGALPNGGRLLYEQFAWGMDGARWLALAADARRELGLEDRL